jgi:hypothetical protein
LFLSFANGGFYFLWFIFLFLFFCFKFPWLLD